MQVATPDGGSAHRVPLRAQPDADPLHAELIALGNSLLYDLWYRFGPHGWAEIFVELPPTGEPVLATRFGNTWEPWEPSGHSIRLVEGYGGLLKERDPGTGYDLLVRHDEIVVCRWPQRAWKFVR